MDYQLSDHEIISIIKHKTKVITYPELNDYKNLNEVFGQISYYIIIIY